MTAPHGNDAARLDRLIKLQERTNELLEDANLKASGMNAAVLVLGILGAYFAFLQVTEPLFDDSLGQRVIWHAGGLVAGVVVVGGVFRLVRVRSANSGR